MIKVVIYSDTSKNPKTKVADITITSLTTLPIPKNNYWEVKPLLNNLNVSISWTPLSVNHYFMIYLELYKDNI